MLTGFNGCCIKGCRVKGCCINGCCMKGCCMKGCRQPHYLLKRGASDKKVGSALPSRVCFRLLALPRGVCAVFCRGVLGLHGFAHV